MRGDLFLLPSASNDRVSVATCIAGVLLFLFCQLTLFPIVAAWLAPFFSLFLTPPMKLAVVQFLLSAALAGMMGGYLYLKREECREWGFSPYGFKEVGIGVLSFFMAYPFVLLLSSGVAYLIYTLGGGEIQTQAAVLSVERVKENPYAFSLLIFGIIFLVPFVEEVVFRGFFLSLFLKKLSPRGALLATSLLFGLFHYAPSQGLSNITIILSLSVLALFLGALKLRRQSLVAPIALHMTFNIFNILLIFLKSD